MKNTAAAVAIAITLLALAIIAKGATPIIKDTGTSPVCRGVQSGDDFQTNVIAKTVSVGGTLSGQVTTGDVVFNSYTSSTVNTLSDIRVRAPLDGALPIATTFSNTTPGVCTFDAAGTSTYVGNGTAICNVTCGTIGTRRVTFSVSQADSTTTQTFANFVSGSMGADLVSGTLGLNTLLASATPPGPGSTTQSLYTTFDTSNWVFVRNTAIFTGSIDLSCIPAATNEPLIPAKRLGCLVTPQHLICAHHNTAGIGTVFYFCDMDNNVYPATVTAQAQIPYPAPPFPVGSYSDIEVLTFSAPLPSNVKPAKVLPSTYATHMASLPSEGLNGFGYPCIQFGQTESIAVGDVTASLSPSNVGPIPSWYVSKSSDVTRSQWYSVPITGDSGSACLMLVNGQAALLGTWYSSNLQNQAYFDGVADYITAINTAIAGSGYTLTAVNLSGYTP